MLRDALQKLAQTARLDSIIPEDFDQPGSSKLPAAQPGISNESFEVSAQSSLPVDTLKPKATYVAPLLSNNEIKTAEMHLHRAAENGNIESLERLLTTIPDILINVKNIGGETPLCAAARYGHAECVKALLGVSGILVNAKDNDGLAPLHYAAKSGHEACLRLLIASKNMKITLLDAARDGQTKVVLEEILKNLNRLTEPAKSEAIMLVLNVVDQGGKNLLCRAAQAGHEEVVALLLNVLNGLSKEKKPEATRAVLSAADSFGRTPLHIAAHHGHYKIVTQLLAEDVETGFSYTCVASKGQEQLAELLKAFPILSAARNGQTTIVARMLKILETWPESERCRAVRTVLTISNKDGATPLHWAACKGHHEVVQQFLNTVNKFQEAEKIDVFGAMVGAVDTRNRTPLAAAVDNGHGEIVDQLIQAFPLMSAVLVRDNQSLEQLMQALKALPGEKRCSAIMAALKKIQPEDGTPLYIAALNKIRAEGGATPLCIAASEGNIEIMKPLLSAVTMLLADGKRKEAREVLYSSCTVKEEYGTMMTITPLRIAASNRHDKAVNLLLEKIRELFTT
ncbi:ankyrin repeat domain-containing protein [Endozoicomonas acroporae]|uniref:ankyrin repeat domain-containing protein n=1 Tax=Endozoicomonas acroporae TaxID=1701104 RepID=UPI0013D10A62|nr:ankyrin repeat domain-containing protein [Endozoicomonas acroporae]